MTTRDGTGLPNCRLQRFVRRRRLGGRAGDGQSPKDNGARVKARAIVEGATGLAPPDGDRILSDKGTFIIPDILANAGGVLVSYFEWVQDLQSFFWEEEEINKRLEQIISRSFREVLALARQERVG